MHHSVNDCLYVLMNLYGYANLLNEFVKNESECRLIKMNVFFTVLKLISALQKVCFLVMTSKRCIPHIKFVQVVSQLFNLLHNCVCILLIYLYSTR